MLSSRAGAELDTEFSPLSSRARGCLFPKSDAQWTNATGIIFFGYWKHRPAARKIPEINRSADDDVFFVPQIFLQAKQGRTGEKSRRGGRQKTRRNVDERNSLASASSIT
jgi:hypothetical protein